MLIAAKRGGGLFFGRKRHACPLQAERALYRMGLPRPEWLDEDYYSKNIQQVEHRVAKHHADMSPYRVATLKRSNLVAAVA